MRIEKRDRSYVVQGRNTWVLTHYPAHSRVVLSATWKFVRTKFEGMVLGVPYHRHDAALTAPMGVWAFARSGPMTGSPHDELGVIDGSSVSLSRVCMGEMASSVYSGSVTPEEAFWNSTFPFYGDRWHYTFVHYTTLSDVVRQRVCIEDHYGFAARFFPHAYARGWDVS